MGSPPSALGRSACLSLSVLLIGSALSLDCGTDPASRVASAGADGAAPDVSTSAPVADAAVIDAEVARPRPATQRLISAGSTHVCALTPTGDVRCWGSNGYGQLGAPISDAENVPVAVTLGGPVASIEAAGRYTCALTRAGGVQCWGRNVRGELGTGSADDRSAVPTDVVGLTGGVLALSAGESHACALLTDGRVRCWGANPTGTLGNDSGADARSPVDIENLGPASAIASGALHTCAIVSRALWCWGDNYSGELGNGTKTSSPVPVDTGLREVLEVWAGVSQTCARLVSGKLFCWGGNDNAQLGLGTTGEVLVPTEISSLGLDKTAVRHSRNHACALDLQGTLRCWGQNVYGALGSPLDADTLYPTPLVVSGLRDAVAEAAVSADATCALLRGGAIQCWGSNHSGQLGNGSPFGSYQFSSAPVDVRLP